METHVFETYIKTTPERLWKAITDPEERAKYSFGVEVYSDWTTGSRYESKGSWGQAVEESDSPIEISVGENIEVDPPNRLVQTFNAMWADEVRAEPTSRVTWEIDEVGTSCRLVVTHDQLRDGANNQLYGGWPMILSGLKTLLETGEMLDTPGSLQYVGRSVG